jgi:hypothetical protein
MATTTRQGTTNVTLAEQRTPEQELRITRLARELRLTDQILSVDLDTVSVVEDGPAPAWTTLDGDHVTFAMKFMPVPMSRLDVAIWLGTNAHELGHVLVSPRKDSPLMRRVVGGEMFMHGLAQLHNIVEDQRQERLVLAKFAPWRAYLVAALGHHLVADSSNAWLLMCGRTWLPQATRDEAKSKFVAVWGIDAADEVADIVGAYQLLTDPGDTESQEAWELLERLHAMFDGQLPDLPTPCGVIRGGEPDTGQPGESAPATASEANERGDGGDGSPDDDEGDEGDAESDAAGASGTGRGNAPKAPPSARAERDALRKALREAAKAEIDADEDVSDDLDDVLDALREGRVNEPADGAPPQGAVLTASDAARRLHREVGDALLDLKDQSEPGWVRRTDSGKLNVRRLVNPLCDPEELFDRYEPGQMDASELEVVLLLDVSGSMQDKTMPLAEAAWAIRHAVDDLDGKATVLTFDDGPHRVMARAGDRPDDRMFRPNAWAGTNPTSALHAAFMALADSAAKNRMMVVLTDGAWFNAGRAHELIAAMRSEGITTVLAELNAYGDDCTEAHGCEFAASINRPTELARLFGRVAEAKIGSWR